MKKEILAWIDNVRSVLRYPINHINNRLMINETFHHYWDVLEFINYIKVKYPEEYEYDDLETYYDIISDFGYFYVKVIKPEPSPTIYDDGILNISTPIEDMIYDLYEYVTNLNDAETTDLKIILDNIHLLREAVLKSNSGVDTKELAKDVLKEVLNPEKETKKLTKKEQIELMATNFSEARKLKLLKKQAKR